MAKHLINHHFLSNYYLIVIMPGEKPVFFFFFFFSSFQLNCSNAYVRMITSEQLSTERCYDALPWVWIGKCWLEFSLVIKVRRGVWLLKCYKNTFLYSIFFYLKTMYISIQPKKYFCCVRILLFKENIFILNQNILLFKKFSYSTGVFFINKIYLYSDKKNVFNETFLLSDFR